LKGKITIFKKDLTNGVTFADANNASTTFTMPDNAVTITANFEPVSAYYTVTFNPNGGIVTGAALTVQIVPHNGDATPPEVERDGYTFYGWYPAGAYLNVTSDRTITAQWTAQGSVTAPAVTYIHPAPGRTRMMSIPAPGTTAFAFSMGVSAARRVAEDIRRDASNDTTAEGILEDIRAVLPGGVTANWSLNTPFDLIPAIPGSDGRITGLIIISAGPYRSAINFNTTISAQNVDLDISE